MRQLTLFLHSSLDGYAEGPNGAIDIVFVAYNEELEQFANKVLSTVDTVLWGRQTSEMMYGYRLINMKKIGSLFLGDPILLFL
ncbi:hypothetical protein LAU42_01330 [Macrococcus armenti]|uniref:hypothetical protein n=1 Tax=Macrococcus armenti TaxID=2875764 RepID=UPI001CCAF52C|nr:hypothetical protein [Macrococcus armenti]UBH22617.1 hypothetical protein LAU42_01330 [Macrococcus armenti]